MPWYLDELPSIWIDERLDAVIEAAGGLPAGDCVSPDDYDSKTRDELRKYLDEAAKHLILTRVTNSKLFGPRQTAAELRRIEGLADELLNAFDRDGNKLAAAMDRELSTSAATQSNEQHALAVLISRENVRQARLRISDVSSWARTRALECEAVGPTPHGSRNRGDPGLDSFIEIMGQAYRDVFARKVGTAVTDDAEGGPFIRFVSTALNQLKIETPSNSALRARIRRVFGPRRKAPAMAKPRQKRI